MAERSSEGAGGADDAGVEPGGDGEGRAGVARLGDGGGGENRPRADQHVGAVLRDLADHVGRRRRAEGDLREREAAGDEGVREGQGLLGRVDGDDGDDAEFGDFLEDVVFVFHDEVPSGG